jgi:hypothetical protein
MGERMNKMKWWQVLLVAVLSPAILVFAVFVLVLFLVTHICIHLLIWSCWCARGRDILFVYSDSPIWHDYIEEHILPFLGARAVVLNWSHRKKWRFSLARMAFHHFGGYREFNPLGVVFRPLRRTRKFRFWQAFRDYKHGHPEQVQKMEREFFDFLGVAGRETNA